MREKTARLRALRLARGYAMDNKGNGGCLNARPKDTTWKPNTDDGKKVLAAVTDGLKPSAAARRTFGFGILIVLQIKFPCTST
jgi:hypothetical protein